MNKLKKIFMTMSASAFMLVPTLAIAGVAYAADPPPPNIANEIKQGSCLQWDADLQTCLDTTTGSGKKANQLVATVTNVFSWVVGVIAVLMIIVGGFKYITSGGDAGKVTSAKNTIVYALIGLVVAVLAQVIVQFVLEKVAPSPPPAAVLVNFVTLIK